MDRHADATSQRPAHLAHPTRLLYPHPCSRQAGQEQESPRAAQETHHGAGDAETHREYRPARGSHPTTHPCTG